MTYETGRDGLARVREGVLSAAELEARYKEERVEDVTVLDVSQDVLASVFDELKQRIERSPRASLNLRLIIENKLMHPSPMAKTKQASNREQSVVIDLRGERLRAPGEIDPESLEAAISEAFSSYAKLEPTRAKELAERFVRAAEAELPPAQRRTLGLREAARLISKTKDIKLHPTQLRRYFDQGRIEIGGLDSDGEPRFSPAECQVFIPPSKRKTGPKPKSSDTSS